MRLHGKSGGRRTFVYSILAHRFSFVEVYPYVFYHSTLYIACYSYRTSLLVLTITITTTTPSPRPRELTSPPCHSTHPPTRDIPTPHGDKALSYSSPPVSCILYPVSPQPFKPRKRTPATKRHTKHATSSSLVSSPIPNLQASARTSSSSSSSSSQPFFQIPSPYIPSNTISIHTLKYHLHTYPQIPSPSPYLPET